MIFGKDLFLTIGASILVLTIVVNNLITPVAENIQVVLYIISAVCLIAGMIRIRRREAQAAEEYEEF